MLKVREQVERKYWSVGHVATIFKCATSKIRFWEGYFQLKIKRHKKGHRQFTAEDLHDLTIIHDLVVLQGYRLVFAKQHFYERKNAN